MGKFNMILAALLIGLSAQSQSEYTLQKCIDYAFQHNAQLKQSALGVEFAEINKRQSFATALPNVNASASHGYNWGQRIDPFTNSFATERIQSNSFGISTGVNIFSGFQNTNTIKQSQIDLAGTQADLEKAQNDLALGVANAYLTVLFNDEFVTMAEATLQGTQNQVDRIRKLVDAGQLPEGNLSEIMAQLASDEANLISAENNLDLSYLSLIQLMQLPYEEAEGFRISKPDLSQFEDLQLVADPAGAISYAQNNMPEIRSAESGIASAETGVAIAKGSLAPRLSASYSYGTGFSGANQVGVGDLQEEFIPIGIVNGTGDLVTSLFPTTSYEGFDTKPFADQLEDNVNQSLFISLSIPIFNGLSAKSSVERAEVSLEMAKYTYETTQLQLRQNVETAYAAAKAAYSNYQATVKVVDAAEIAFSYAEVRFEQGVINLVDYSDARIRLDNARAEMIRNRYDYVLKTKIIDFYRGQPLTLR